MSSFVPLVPSAKQSGAGLKSLGSTSEPAFNAPVRWTLRALAWLAFGVASYLAWSAMTKTAVAGCTMGSHVGCDLVLSSSWSKWLGIPVSVLGLGCYATLSTLSLFLGVRDARANRWITTIFVLFSITAAGASLWFVALQVFSLNTFCQWCLVADSCGIALGIISTAFAVRSVQRERGMTRSSAPQPGLAAIRPTAPVASRTPSPKVRVEPASPWLIPALGGAIPLLGLLIGGQLLFASKTFDVEKVALKDSIQMDGAKADEIDAKSTNGTERVALRVPNETDSNVRPSLPADSNNQNAKSDATGKKDSGTNAEKEKATPPSASSSSSEPKKQKLVKFLGGKLTIDVYQHPVVGSRDAPHFAIEMLSYDCPHCRKMFPKIEHALERYGDQVALVVMMIPMDKECNKLITDPAASHPGACATARLSLGVAKTNPGSFANFHDFLMSGDKEKPPAMAAALPKAYVLSDRSRLREAIQGDEVNKQLDGYVELFGKLQKQSGKKEFGLPVQILGDHVMHGSVEKEEDVFKAWEEHLGVKPK